MGFNLQPNGDLEIYGLGCELLTWSFAPNGGSSPTTFSGAYLQSVTRTGTGQYTLVFSGKNWRAVLDANCTVRDNASLDRTSDVNDPGVITSNTLTVKVITKVGSTGAAVDVAANAASWVRGTLLLKSANAKDSTGL